MADLQSPQAAGLPSWSASALFTYDDAERPGRLQRLCPCHVGRPGPLATLGEPLSHHGGLSFVVLTWKAAWGGGVGGTQPAGYQRLYPVEKGNATPGALKEVAVTIREGGPLVAGGSVGLH